MDFSFSEEQEAVRELADRIFTDLSTQERLREIESGPDGDRFDRKLWAELAARRAARHRPARGGGRRRARVRGDRPAGRGGRPHRRLRAGDRDAGRRGAGHRPVRHRGPTPAVAARRGGRRHRADHRPGRARRHPLGPGRGGRAGRRRLGADRGPRPACRRAPDRRRRAGPGPGRARLRWRCSSSTPAAAGLSRRTPDGQHRPARGLLTLSGVRVGAEALLGAVEDGPGHHRVAGPAHHRRPGPGPGRCRGGARSPWWPSTPRPGSSSASRSPPSRPWASGRPTPTSTPRPSG